MKKFAILAMTALFLAGAACGSDSKTPAPTPTTAPAPAPTTTTAPAPTTTTTTTTTIDLAALQAEREDKCWKQWNDLNDLESRWSDLGDAARLLGGTHLAEWTRQGREIQGLYRSGADACTGALPAGTLDSMREIAGIIGEILTLSN